MTASKTQQKQDKYGDESLKLNEEIANLKKENKGLIEQLQRLQAEFQNYQKRAEKEKKSTQEYGIAGFLVKILQIYEDIQRFSSNNEGADLILKNFSKILQEEGVMEIDCLEKQFDPYLHEVVATKESEQPENTILQVVQKGYFFKDKVLRNARVIIAKNPKDKSGCDVA